MKATERVASGAAVAVRRVDLGAIDDEVERLVCLASIPSPVDAILAGVVHGATSSDKPATDKE